MRRSRTAFHHYFATLIVMIGWATAPRAAMAAGDGAQPVKAPAWGASPAKSVAADLTEKQLYRLVNAVPRDSIFIAGGGGGMTTKNPNILLAMIDPSRQTGGTGVGRGAGVGAGGAIA